MSWDIIFHRKTNCGFSVTIGHRCILDELSATITHRCILGEYRRHRNEANGLRDKNRDTSYTDMRPYMVSNIYHYIIYYIWDHNGLNNIHPTHNRTPYMVSNRIAHDVVDNMLSTSRHDRTRMTPYMLSINLKIKIQYLQYYALNIATRPHTNDTIYDVN